MRDTYNVNPHDSARRFTVTVERKFEANDDWRIGDLGFLAATRARKYAKLRALGKVTRYAKSSESDTQSGREIYTAAYHY